jgi:hypothetical protein
MINVKIGLIIWLIIILYIFELIATYTSTNTSPQFQTNAIALVIMYAKINISSFINLL